jgi:ATP-dependent DNA helicase RecG
MTLGTETETLEFKKSTGELKEAVISIVAILNKHQKGALYFGVKPDGTPVGQIVTEKSLRDISHKISEAVEPKIYPQITKVVLDGRDCIHVSFAGTEIPYFAFGIAQMRVSDEDIALSPKERKRQKDTP